MQHTEVEQGVLNVYRKVNPSFVDIADKETYKKYEEELFNFLHFLGLPTQLFVGKKLIDIGGGTGEKTFFYSLWGADVTLLEPNELACQKAQELFLRNNRKINVINQSLYDIDSNILKDFDMLVCDGVLHHTFDPVVGLNMILKSMKRGAVVIISMAEYHGWFKRNLQRSFVRERSTNEKETIVLSKKYFQEHLDRAVKFGLRTEEAVIADTFINPQIQPTKLQTICRSFIQNGISYLAAYPTLNCFYQTNPWAQTKSNRFNYDAHQGYYQFLEKMWMTCGEEDTRNSLLSFPLNALKERIDREFNKLCINPFPEIYLPLIQKGYMGIGNHYFVGVKE